MSTIQWTLAIAGILAPALVLLVMMRRKLRVRFPFLFSYLILYIASSCVGLAAFLYSCSLFIYVNWVLGSLIMLMEIGIIYEILVNTLKSYSALADFAKLLFRWAVVFLFFTALITALATNGQQATRLEAATNLIEHCIRLMQCGLLLFLLVFENRLGISWRNHGVAIAVGLGAYAAVDLAISYVGNAWISIRVADLIEGSVYIGMLAFWGCFLSLREPTPKSVLDSPSRLIFQRWNEALMATPLMARKHQVAFAPVESFLPGVEQTVERVMARKMMH